MFVSFPRQKEASQPVRKRNSAVQNYGSFPGASPEKPGRHMLLERDPKGWVVVFHEIKRLEKMYA